VVVYWERTGCLHATKCFFKVSLKEELTPFEVARKSQQSDFQEPWKGSNREDDQLEIYSLHCVSVRKWRLAGNQAHLNPSCRKAVALLLSNLINI